MTNRRHRSIISAKAGFLDGRLRGSLRIYMLGAGPAAEIFLSLNLWQASAAGQERAAVEAACALR
jgi:hypothetical protein